MHLTNRNNTNRDVISLFSGAMGLDIGLSKAGLNVVIGQDFEPSCVKTMQENGHNVLGGDIREIDPQTILDQTGLSIGEPFLICGGPPCQPFSTAGKRLGIGSIRLHIYHLYAIIPTQGLHSMSPRTRLYPLLSKVGYPQ